MSLWAYTGSRWGKRDRLHGGTKQIVGMIGTKFYEKGGENEKNIGGSSHSVGGLKPKGRQDGRKECKSGVQALQGRNGKGVESEVGERELERGIKITDDTLLRGRE